MALLEFLADKKVVSKADLPAIREEAKSRSLEEVLLGKGVGREDLLTAKGEYFSLPTKLLDEEQIPFEILNYIPEESALHYMFAPIALKDDFLEVGIVDPDNFEARDALNFISNKIGKPFKLFIITEADFKKVSEQYRGLSGEVTKALTELDSDLTDEEKEIARQAEEEKGKRGISGTTIIEDAPVTKIVATILRYAVEGNASDVHVEHMYDKIRVRFRMDGVLNTSLILPVAVHAAVVARIKVLCNMRLDERRKPQDGSFSARIEGRTVDFRVSTFPAYYGEKVVMRILDKEKGVKTLEDLGLRERDMKLIREALDRPFGLILISGPTGSGKTTTLYAMLNEVDKEQNNVLSLEDPVEYNIDGISQSQVRPEIGYTFASGLRTTLRQDPDIIMVGEIRDKETAQLAVQAALTGHLVFSTIHTNTAAGIVPRLVDMGVDPYLIPPTLILGIAQRLVRKICPNSGRVIPIEGAVQMMIDKQFSDLKEEFKKELPFGKEVLGLQPAPDCPNGTRGREAVFEVFKMDHDIEDVILKNPVESEIYDAARAKGMLTMKEDALIKAFQKLIPFEEVNKL